MKFNTLRLVYIACLLLIVNVSYAEPENTPVTKEASKVKVDKLQSGVTRLGAGGLVTSQTAGYNNDAEFYKKRVEELEKVISEQQKLIEMYKNRH